MEIPLRFGHFEVLRDGDGQPTELGRGAMGITYKAFDPSLQRIAAIKVIHAEHLGPATSRERFMREARSAARLLHPNIATVFQFGEEGSVCFYAMEFIAGESLEARVQRAGPLPCGAA